MAIGVNIPIEPEDRERFLGRSFVADVVANGFDCGARFDAPETSVRCRSSSERMIHDLADELGYDPEGDETIIVDKLVPWFRLRLAYVENTLGSCERTPDGDLVCTRVLIVDEDAARDIAHGRSWPGEFWSSGGDAQPYWADEDGRPELVLEAHIPATSIDWKTTVSRNLNYLYGDDEIEIVLKREAPVQIVSASYDGQNLELDTNAAPRP